MNAETNSNNPTTALPTCLRTDVTEAGVDEAGRGCLAGPVVAAAVILPSGFSHPEINDSKKLSEKTRNRLELLIKQKAEAWSIGIASEEEIGHLNILGATMLAMHRAIAGLNLVPEHLAVDGNRFSEYPNIPHTTVIKGDGRYANIAAASILAKTARDRIMEELHTQYPQYGWSVNKGYPTTAHRQAIALYGLSPRHRPGFKHLP